MVKSIQIVEEMIRKKVQTSRIWKGDQGRIVLEKPQVRNCFEGRVRGVEYGTNIRANFTRGL